MYKYRIPDSRTAHAGDKGYNDGQLQSSKEVTVESSRAIWFVLKMDIIRRCERTGRVIKTIVMATAWSTSAAAITVDKAETSLWSVVTGLPSPSPRIDARGEREGRCFFTPCHGFRFAHPRLLLFDPSVARE
ncbi:MAG: hypothetical protein K9M57_06940 [Phycisphaerae bacterium]|nr:hypothetical protein [Phycisphaerae bacterium]